MKKFIVVLLLIALVISSVGCTKRSRARRFGGTETIKLEANQKLVVATWKDDEFWYLTRAARKGEVPEKYTFQENSKFGFIEGTIIIQEFIVQ